METATIDRAHHIDSGSGLRASRTPGIPMTIKLKITDIRTGNACPHGAAVALWHCDRDGRGLHGPAGEADRNAPRGVQVVDDEGLVTFETTFPGCSGGRWPHLGVEVYPSVAALTGGGRIAALQLALPTFACHSVYATSGYAGSHANFATVSLATDPVFEHASRDHLVNVTGSVFDGFVARFAAAVAFPPAFPID